VWPRRNAPRGRRPISSGPQPTSHPRKRSGTEATRARNEERAPLPSDGPRNAISAESDPSAFSSVCRSTSILALLDGEPTGCAPAGKEISAYAVDAGRVSQAGNTSWNRHPCHRLRGNHTSQHAPCGPAPEECVTFAQGKLRRSAHLTFAGPGCSAPHRPQAATTALYCAAVRDQSTIRASCGALSRTHRPQQ